jgi:SAM-dependent methyltransferase
MNDPFRATQLAQDWIAERLRPGDTAIDATAGNGHDTVFLAERVGESGHVYAFDIQSSALAVTRRRLEEHGLLPRVTLVEADHEELEVHLPPLAGAVRAIMFNLGYLPAGEKSVITRTASTLPALQAALRLLAPGGLVSVICYSVHEGGREEADAVIEFCEKLDPSLFGAIRCHVLNFERTPPFVIAIEKRRPGSA